MFAGPTFWPVEQSVEVLSAYRDFISDAPRELNGFFAYHTVPPAPPFPEHVHLREVCGVVWCHLGSEEQAVKDMAPLLDSLPEPILHGPHYVPFPGLQGVFDALYPKGEQWYWRADFVNEIPDEAVELHHRFGSAMPSRQLADAHVPDRRRGPRRGRVRHRVGLSRRALGQRLRGRRPRPGERRRDPPAGASTTRRRCTRTRPAAPT